MRPGVARANEDTADNLHRRVKRLAKQVGDIRPVEPQEGLEKRLEALETKVQGLVLNVGRLRAALKRAGVQPEED